ncbi:hypothetical protein GDO78_006051 [Eleutherodactylus coqui]|uniref:Uncharacterized protein n=1 Tax=Eleutherodactylus coqui TaxID=57060 RepID=A0A8J6KIR0_ELECQ|nr:hypothetical protein GDO78_006051 [Eleutherodactylus coqui]
MLRKDSKSKNKTFRSQYKHWVSLYTFIENTSLNVELFLLQLRISRHITRCRPHRPRAQESGDRRKTPSYRITPNNVIRIKKANAPKPKRQKGTLGLDILLPPWIGFL